MEIYWAVVTYIRRTQNRLRFLLPYLGKLFEKVVAQQTLSLMVLSV